MQLLVYLFSFLALSKRILVMVETRISSSLPIGAFVVAVLNQTLTLPRQMLLEFAEEKQTSKKTLTIPLESQNSQTHGIADTLQHIPKQRPPQMIQLLAAAEAPQAQLAVLRWRPPLLPELRVGEEPLEEAQALLGWRGGVLMGWAGNFKKNKKSIPEM